MEPRCATRGCPGGLFGAIWTPFRVPLGALCGLFGMAGGCLGGSFWRSFSGHLFGVTFGPQMAGLQGWKMCVFYVTVAKIEVWQKINKELNSDAFGVDFGSILRPL